jgi:hypothetical protein
MQHEPLIVMNCLHVAEKFGTSGIFRRMLTDVGIKAERLVVNNHRAMAGAGERNVFLFEVRIADCCSTVT